MRKRPAQVFIALCMLVSALCPAGAEAATRVHVRFSVGGGVVIGAAAIVWGISYGVSSGFQESVSSETDPFSVRFKTTAPLPDGLVPAAESPPVPGPPSSDRIEIHLLHFRW